MAISDKEAARAVVEQLPDDASLDEVIWALGVRCTTMLDADAPDRLASVIAAAPPQQLVEVDRSARLVTIPGISRQVAQEVIAQSPDDATLDEIAGRLSLWTWPEAFNGPSTHE